MTLCFNPATSKDCLSTVLKTGLHAFAVARPLLYGAVLLDALGGGTVPAVLVVAAAPAARVGEVALAVHGHVDADLGIEREREVRDLLA